jgi:hypothetical protein
MIRRAWWWWVERDCIQGRVRKQEGDNLPECVQVERGSWKEGSEGD